MSSKLVFWVAVVVLSALVGCGGGDDGDEDSDREKRPAPAAGTFVGTLEGSDTFVAVVAAPPAKGEERRGVTAFVCDAEELCSWFSGSTSGNDFVAKSGGAEGGETRGKLSGKTVTGSVELPDGQTERYKVGQAAATAGLYDLTVSPRGKVSGASAAGVALKGEVTLPPPGSGRLKLADGTRLKFEVIENSAGDDAELRAGQLRLIVLPEGKVRGAGKSRGDDGAAFFVRSTSK